MLETFLLMGTIAGIIAVTITLGSVTVWWAVRYDQQLIEELIRADRRERVTVSQALIVSVCARDGHIYYVGDLVCHRCNHLRSVNNVDPEDIAWAQWLNRPYLTTISENHEPTTNP